MPINFILLFLSDCSKKHPHPIPRNYHPYSCQGWTVHWTQNLSMISTEKIKDVFYKIMVNFFNDVSCKVYNSSKTLRIFDQNQSYDHTATNIKQQDEITASRWCFSFHWELKNQRFVLKHVNTYHSTYTHPGVTRALAITSNSNEVLAVATASSSLAGNYESQASVTTLALI